MAKTNILIIEDEQVIRRSLSSFFNGLDDYEVTCSYESVEDFNSDLTSTCDPNIVLLDINLPGMNGIDGIPFINNKYPHVNIIMLTTFDDPEHIFSALQNGAISYILKKSPIWDIKQAIETVLDGGSFMSPGIARLVIQSFNAKQVKRKNLATLTNRQQEVLDAIVDGLSYKMIAEKFNISLHTSNDHIKAIYKKLQVNSKAEAITMALKDRM